MEWSLGLEIGYKMETKIDETYHVARHKVLGKIVSFIFLAYVGKIKETIFRETSCDY